MLSYTFIIKNRGSKMWIELDSLVNLDHVIGIEKSEEGLQYVDFRDEEGDVTYSRGFNTEEERDKFYDALKKRLIKK